MKNQAGAAVLACLGVMACGGAQEEPAAAIEPVEAVESDAAVAPVEETQQIQGAALAATLNDPDVLVLDVRNPDELEEYGTVEGYINIPIDELADRLSELPKDKPILTA